LNNIVRSTRVAMRCTEKERQNLLRIAADLEISLTTLMRDSITIAYSNANNPYKWRRHINKAKDVTPEEFRWSTS
jgi:hypothetical protein